MKQHSYKLATPIRIIILCFTLLTLFFVIKISLQRFGMNNHNVQLKAITVKNPLSHYSAKVLIFHSNTFNGWPYTNKGSFQYYFSNLYKHSASQLIYYNTDGHHMYELRSTIKRLIQKHQPQLTIFIFNHNNKFTNNDSANNLLTTESLLHHPFTQQTNELASLLANEEKPFLFVAPPYNLLDWSPKSQSTRNKEKWSYYFNSGKKALANLDYLKALSEFKSAYTLNKTRADISYYLGRSYLALQRINPARYFLKQAQASDLSAYRFHAPLARSLKHAALSSKYGHFLNLQKKMALRTHYKLIGNELFWDHTHPNSKGNFLMAQYITKSACNILNIPIPEISHPIPENLTQKQIHFIERLTDLYLLNNQYDHFKKIISIIRTHHPDLLLNQDKTQAALKLVQLHQQQIKKLSLENNAPPNAHLAQFYSKWFPKEFKGDLQQTTLF